jgi:hypothetical protein
MPGAPDAVQTVRKNRVSSAKSHFEILYSNLNEKTMAKLSNYGLFVQRMIFIRTL